jgi:arylsulfatase A-like enzyme
MIHFNSKRRLKSFFSFLLFLSSYSTINAQQKPNIIFILADDVGYDILSVNGNKSYSTPNIDSMAHHGINFTHCEGTPLCSPSRCMLLTGKYNFRNYSNWGYMSDREKTFGNVMQDAGYKTGFFGKLQLPFSYSSMANWGFNKFTVFELIGDTAETLRYKNPTLYDNTGKVPDSLTLNKYCDDILTSRILNFIDSNSKTPFFIYYSMSIAHTPFSPTPEDSVFKNWNPRKKISDTIFFNSMIAHMDMEVGKIINRLKKTGLDKNTIILFAGDNGTPLEVVYNTDDDESNEGEKSSTAEGGTHVPLIAYWPSHIPENTVNDDLVDFTDFLPTFAEAGGIKDLSAYDAIDGLSFFNRMLGVEDHSKPQLFMHYCSHPGFKPLKRWVRDKNYKLYYNLNNGSYKFYNIIQDKEEKSPLSNDNLTKQEKEIKKRFKYILDSMPTWSDAPVVNNPFIKDVTSKSATIGATIISSGSTTLIDRGSNLCGPSILPRLGINTIHDSVAILGTFFQSRINLTSEHQYLFSVYATNKNASHSTDYVRGKFYTLSEPPQEQPSYFKACADSSSILLSWDHATFPASGARLKGYAIFYSTDEITVSQNPDGKDFSKVAVNAKLLYADSNICPYKLDTVLHISSLDKNKPYYFLLVPYTWNGGTDSTSNYLIEGALKTSAQLTSNLFKIHLTDNNPLCFNTSNGSIAASVSYGASPYLFELNNKSFTSDSIFKNLKAGTYLIRVKDNNGCTDSQKVTLANPTPLQLNATGISAVCYGDTASIVASSNNGTGPYKYALNNSDYVNDSVFTNLSKESFNLKVKDANGCVDSETVVLTPPEQLKLDLSEEDANCAPDGEIIALASNGVQPYLFSFNNHEFNTAHEFTNLAKGNYTIKVKDGNKCTVSGNITVKAIHNCFTGITISPNPTNSEFKLRIGNNLPSNHIEIRVYDVKGKLIYSNHGNNIKSYSFGKNFMSGIYFVKVESGNDKYNFKIIKE